MATIQRLLYLLSVFIISKTSSQERGCLLKYVDFPPKEPVFFKSNLSIIEPNNAGIKLKTNEEIILACTGAKNNLSISGSRETKAKCVKGEILKIADVEYDLHQLNCSKDVVGDVNVTGTPCGNRRGVIKNIGHTLSNKKFSILFSVCYDDNRGESIYSQHIIYGSAIRNTKKDSSRLGFKTPGLGPEAAAHNSYKQTTQKSTFSALLGSSLLAEQYIYDKSNDKSYLARGHLAPDGDFVYVSSQHSSYFYINTIPQWQVINNGNWKSLEFSIRNVAAGLNKTLHIYTGGYQTLKLPDINSNPTEIYLIPKRKLIPIPKFTWKVIYEPRSKSGIAFVTVNNPFIRSIEPEDILCRNICDENGWNVPSWKNPAKGYTYCCSVNELKKIIKTVPTVGTTKDFKTTIN